MSYLKIIEKFITYQKEQNKLKVFTTSLEQIPYMKISELARRDIALEIFSEVLGCEIWFCSDEEIADQIQNDDPEAIVYTASELIELFNIDPKEDLVKAIHYSKTVFQGSKLTKNKF